MNTVETKATEWTENDVVAFLMEVRIQPVDVAPSREEMFEYWGRSTSAWTEPVDHGPVKRWVEGLRSLAAVFL